MVRICEWRWLRFLPGLLLLLDGAGGPLAAAAETTREIAVIAHPGFSPATLTATELALVFRRSQRIDARGVALVPVNLPGTDPLRVAFSLALFDLEPADMEAYWNERYFHGVAPPHVVASVEAMLRFVAATDGAIGYVPACAVDARVTVVARLRTAHGAAGLQCP